MSFELSRKQYADLYGPTTGDAIRLADTELFLEIEKDLTAYGEEVVFGGGKVIRDGMGQNGQATRDENVPDTVITNAVILDYTGIYKADVAIRDGHIFKIGKAGNPQITDGVDIVIGASTEIIAGERKILTAGGVDTHIHFISPDQVPTALASGVTTMVGGGTGPAEGTKATTVTPGKWHIQRMLQAAEGMPINIGLFGKGHASAVEPLAEQIRAGAIGLKVHEDWGSTTSSIDNSLKVADEYDVQVAIHTDTLNECGFVEDTIRAIDGRVIHTFHTEGAGGGHAPDIIRIAGLPNVLPASTNPTLPYTRNTIEEHLDMLMVCHHLNPDIPEDVAFADSRIRAETIAAEDVLQDLGIFAITSSDSQAMGRVGEVITRTWQVADKMKKQRGVLKDPAGGTHGAPDWLRCGQRQLPAQALRGEIHHQRRHRAGHGRLHRLRGGGKVRRPGALGPGVLRRETGAGAQGRADRLRADGRRQRLHPHPAAAHHAPDVRRVRQGGAAVLHHLPVPGRHRCRGAG